MKPKRKPWGGQAFLNAARATDRGWVSASVTYPKWKQGMPEICLHVGDCSRVVSLDFDIDSDHGGSKEMRIKKVKRLRRVITEFCDAAEAALAEAELYPKKDETKK